MSNLYKRAELLPNIAIIVAAILLSAVLLKNSWIQVVAVVPQNINEGQKYLNGLGVAVDEIEQVSLTSIGVRGTPTLIMMDGAGKVVKSWTGKLTPDQENEVLSQL